MDFKEKCNILRSKYNLNKYYEKFLSPDKIGGYICFCGSGSGENGTGLKQIEDDFYYCFRCEETYDIFELLHKVKGISKTDAFKMVCEWTNADESLFNGEYKPMVKTEAKKNNKKNNKPFDVQMSENKFIIQEALKNKSDIELKNYLLKRGIWNFDKLAKENLIGFYKTEVKNIKYKDKIYKLSWIPYSSAIFITSKNSFVYNYIGNHKGIIDKWRKGNSYGQGNQHLFLSHNLDKLQGSDIIYICEGVLDAPSIYQYDIYSVSLNSACNTKLLTNYIKNNLSIDKIKNCTFLLALDLDQEGNDKTRALQSELLKMQLKAVDIRKQIIFTGKDINDALTTDKKQFEEKLKSITNDSSLLANLFYEQKKQFTTDTTATDDINKEEINIDSEEAKFEEVFEKPKSQKALEFFTNYSNRKIIEKRKRNPSQSIPTGFKYLDDILGGGLEKELYIIGAGSSVGKTTLLLQIGYNLSECGQKVLFFTYEHSDTSLINKILSRFTFEISKKKIESEENLERVFYINRKNVEMVDKKYKEDLQRATIKELSRTSKQINKEIFTLQGIYLKNINATFQERYRSNYENKISETVEEAEEKLNQNNNFIIIPVEIENKFSVLEIKNYIETYIQITGEKPIVIIDYLQTISPLEDKMTDKQATDRTIRELKMLSRTNNIPILAISSINRSSYNSSIDFNSFKESGGIEFGADNLLGLQLAGVYNEGEKIDNEKKISIENARQQAEPVYLELKILKSREGCTGNTYLKFTHAFNYFESIPRPSEEKLKEFFEKYKESQEEKGKKEKNLRREI